MYLGEDCFWLIYYMPIYILSVIFTDIYEMLFFLCVLAFCSLLGSQAQQFSVRMGRVYSWRQACLCRAGCTSSGKVNMNTFPLTSMVLPPPLKHGIFNRAIVRTKEKKCNYQANDSCSIMNHISTFLIVYMHFFIKFVYM